MIEKLPHYLYFVVMGIVVIGWLALILFPRQRWANFWFAGLIVPLILSLTYTYLLVTYWFQPPVATLTQFIELEGVYAMPVSFVWGSADPTFPEPLAREMASQFPNVVEFRSIARGKLFMHEEFPEAVSQAVLQALGNAAVA